MDNGLYSGLYIIGALEKNMETTITGYTGGYIGTMEKKLDIARVFSPAPGAVETRGPRSVLRHQLP